jgi:hypothetical protein
VGLWPGQAVPLSSPLTEECLGSRYCQAHSSLPEASARVPTKEQCSWLLLVWSPVTGQRAAISMTVPGPGKYRLSWK